MLSGRSEQTLQITERLLTHMLELLEHSPDVDRIESQMLLYDSGVIAKPFQAAALRYIPGSLWSYDHRPVRSIIPKRVLLPEYLELKQWSPANYQAAAELIHAAYANHIDASINDQYRSLHGSLRFLHNIVRFPGCGIFEAGSSWVLRDKRTDTLAGLLLCSRVAPEVAHITQICVGRPLSRSWAGPGLDGALHRPARQCGLFGDHAYRYRGQSACGAAL